MLQVARLSPNLLHEAADSVVEFLLGELNEDGGARDRAGKSDLYYTAFALEALIALRAELPRERVVPYLEGFGAGESLDLVHRACLVRAWSSVSMEGAGPSLGDDAAASILAALEEHRSADGGYGTAPGAESGTLYNAFLALGVYQDLGREMPAPEDLAESVARLRTDDGGYADSHSFAVGTTPSTAAAATLLRHLELPVDREVGEWLLARFHGQGGFLAIPGAPIPDLLSTATTLHALAGLEVPFDPIRERCLDFLDTLWTGRGFCGHWEDDEVDCEYAFYALLALGHLSL